MSATVTVPAKHSTGSVSAEAPPFYRPELDVLRFFAFLFVFFHHNLPRTAETARLNSHSGHLLTSFANGMGSGLCLFFVLSAYLITELLVREKTAKGKLDVRSFYIRRILRIWPLYFLGLAIGVVYVLFRPESSSLWRFGAYALLMGNWYCVVHTASTTPVDILWSISVEEQFYLIWPWVSAANAKWVLKWTAAALMVISMATLLILGALGATTDTVWFNSLVQFGMFGAGATVSLVLKGGAPKLPMWARGSMFLSAVVLWWVSSYLTHIKDPFVSPSGINYLIGYTCTAIGSVLLLLAFLGIPSRWLPGPLIYLGKISFGLYVFHAIARMLTYVIAPGRSPLHLLLGFPITVAFAMISYTYFEKPFLKLKRHFEVVKTRPV